MTFNEKVKVMEYIKDDDENLNDTLTEIRYEASRIEEMLEKIEKIMMEQHKMIKEYYQEDGVMYE